MPSRWLTGHADWLPATGDALDVACGRGRHAIWLAQRGLRTVAVDRDAEAIDELRRVAGELALPLHAAVMDLESAHPSLGVQQYDVIVGVHYLHRPLFPALVDALRPGGLLVYETFTVEQAKRGRPKNPAFLLEPGELMRLTRRLTTLDCREGEVDGRMVASVIARKGGTTTPFGRHRR